MHILASTKIQAQAGIETYTVFIETCLLQRSDYAVSDWSCRGHDTGPEEACAFEIVFIRRGTLILEAGDFETVLTSNETWLLTPGMKYRIRHPRGGDDCTILRLSETLLDQYPRWKKRRRPVISTHAGFGHQLQMRSAALRNDDLLSDESVQAILDDAFAAPQPTNIKQSQRRLVSAAQEVLAHRFAEKLALSDVASAVGTSPYHLARLFRRATGETMHRYQTGLRLRAAASRLAAGERNLAALAVELGFFDQSHFTNAFRRAFGTPPSSLRK